MNSIRSLMRAHARLVLGSSLVAALVVTGCGGGVDTGGTGTPGALSFSTGRIAGFGSVIVNGVRFDDSTAAVVDDDGTAHDRSELKLGMTVEVHGGPVVTDASAGTSTSTATNVKFGTAINGPVQAIDVAGSTLNVLGQSVKVDAATVFDGFANGLASVQAGNLVEVSALLDQTTGIYTATRIEFESALAEYRLRGVIANLDATAKTFTIGGATINYAGIPAAQMATVVNGALVRVKLQTAQQGSTWIATQVGSATVQIADQAEAEVEGFITEFVSLGNFKVQGITIDASGSNVVFANVTPAQLANGSRVEVEGVTAAGVLVARKVALKQSDGGDQEFELHGLIESVDAAGQSFVLRGVVVTYASTTRFDNGSAANLVVGASVEVKGLLSGNGGGVAATRVKFGE